MVYHMVSGVPFPCGVGHGQAVLGYCMVSGVLFPSGVARAWGLCCSQDKFRCITSANGTHWYIFNTNLDIIWRG